jgi:hypothetical protein
MNSKVFTQGKKRKFGKGGGREFFSILWNYLSSLVSMCDRPHWVPRFSAITHPLSGVTPPPDLQLTGDYPDEVLSSTAVARAPMHVQHPDVRLTCMLWYFFCILRLVSQVVAIVIVLPTTRRPSLHIFQPPTLMDDNSVDHYVTFNKVLLILCEKLTAIYWSMACQDRPWGLSAAIAHGSLGTVIANI